MDDEARAAAAIVIQRNQRSKVATKQVEKMRAERARLGAEHSAALVIQRNHRVKAASQKVKAMRREMHATVLASAFEMFELYDLNGDGNIDRDEYFKVSSKVQKPGTKWTKEMSDAELNSIDADHNSRINPEEFYAHVRKKLALEQAVFEAAVAKHQDVTMDADQMHNVAAGAQFWLDESPVDPELVADVVLWIESHQKRDCPKHNPLHSQLSAKVTGGWSDQDLAAATQLLKSVPIKPDPQIVSTSMVKLQARSRATDLRELAASLNMQRQGSDASGEWTAVELIAAADVLEHRQRAEKVNQVLVELGDLSSEADIQRAARAVLKREAEIQANFVVVEAHVGVSACEVVGGDWLLDQVRGLMTDQELGLPQMHAAASKIRARLQAQAAAELISEIDDQRVRAGNELGGDLKDQEVDSAACVVARRQLSLAECRLATEIQEERERENQPLEDPWTEEELHEACAAVQTRQRARLARELISQMQQDQEEALTDHDGQEDLSESRLLSEMRVGILANVDERSDLEHEQEPESLQQQIQRNVEERALKKSALDSLRNEIFTNVAVRTESARMLANVSQRAQNPDMSIEEQIQERVRERALAASQEAFNAKFPEGSFDQDELTQAAIAIQNKHRQKAARELLEQMKQDRAQSSVPDDAEYSEEEMAKAATAIQARQRAKAANLLVAQMKEERKRANEMSDSPWTDEEMAKAATVIQSRHRMKVANKVGEQLREDRSAVSIEEQIQQRVADRARAREFAMNATDEEVAAATVIQSRHRANAASKQVHQRRQQISDEEAMLAAATSIQSRQRAKAANRLVVQMREERERQGLGLDTQWSQAEMERAATVIQSRQRAKVSSALVDQVRAERDRLKLPHDDAWTDEEMHNAAIAIQARHRAKAARALIAQMRVEQGEDVGPDPELLDKAEQLLGSKSKIAREIRTNIEARASQCEGPTMEEQIRARVLARLEDTMEGTMTTGALLEAYQEMHSGDRNVRLSSVLQEKGYNLCWDDQWLEDRASDMYNRIVVEGSVDFRGVPAQVYLNRVLEVPENLEGINSLLHVEDDRLAEHMANAATLIQKQQRAKAARKEVHRLRDEALRTSKHTEQPLREHDVGGSDDAPNDPTVMTGEIPESWPADAATAYKAVVSELGAVRQEKRQLIRSLNATQDRAEGLERDLHKSRRVVLRLQNQLEMETMRAALTRRGLAVTPRGERARAKQAANQKTEVQVSTNPMVITKPRYTANDLARQAWKQRQHHAAYKNKEALNGPLAPISPANEMPAQGSPSSNVRQIRHQRKSLPVVETEPYLSPPSPQNWQKTPPTFAISTNKLCGAMNAHRQQEERERWELENMRLKANSLIADDPLLPGSRRPSQTNSRRGSHMSREHMPTGPVAYQPMY